MGTLLSLWCARTPAGWIKTFLTDFFGANKASESNAERPVDTARTLVRNSPEVEVQQQ